MDIGAFIATTITIVALIYLLGLSNEDSDNLT